MAGLDISEIGMPQSGRIELTVSGRQLGISVHTLPTTSGEACVLRFDTAKTRGADSPTPLAARAGGI
jgi:type II secretory ATPase GspE/PulE/Tfp pilus assembly ATPase PilB-like protein